MGGLEKFDWEVYVQLFLVGAFPWLAQLKNLDIHFKYQDFDSKGIFNFFASLFAMSSFIFLQGELPESLIENLWSWEFFMGTAFIFSVIFLFIFIYFKERVTEEKTKWPIFLNFFLYVLLFQSLTIGFGILRVRMNNYILEGRATSNCGKRVSNLEVLVFDAKESVIGSALTANDGRFTLILSKVNFTKFNAVKVGETLKYPEQNTIQITLKSYDICE